jgi:hypothetical protein
MDHSPVVALAPTYIGQCPDSWEEFDMETGQISTEGRLGLLLGLIGLAGAGAMNVWPEQAWIGKTLLAISAAGFVALFFYHFWGRLGVLGRPATWSPNGTVQDGKVRAGIGLVLLCGLMASGYVASQWDEWSIASIIKEPPHQPILLPPSSLASRSDKFIFACDIPRDPKQTPEKYAEQKAELQKELKVWGDVIGFAVTTSDIEGGFRIIIEAETQEAKNRMVSAGIWPAVTKVFIDVRRIGQRVIVSAYADLPKGMEFFSMIPPDPTLPQVVTAEKQIAQFLGANDGACHLI